MSNAVIIKLNELGYTTIPDSFYSKVYEWKSWYQGNVKGFHNYTVQNGISIHAPREGGDKFGGCLLWMLYLFQSTPPARGATCGAKMDGGDSNISIHAPREGGDTLIFIV